MGKGEEKSAEEDADSITSEEQTEENTDSEEDTEEQSKETKEETSESTPEKEEEPKEKKDKESIRKVIKIEENNEQEKKSEDEDVDLDSTSKSTLEQKRAILQSIKDFDFQIKKNQEEITGLNKKLDSVSKDLDDLVSLYEIVSEQMNPFVGLSKVTKKRIDALENFTKEIDDLKTRMGDLESFAERSGADLQSLKSLEHTQDEKEETSPNQKSQTFSPDLDPDDIDKIIEKSLNSLSMENAIDNAIDDFIETLKT